MPGMFINGGTWPWVGLPPKDDSSMDININYKYILANRYYIFMQHLWPKSQFINRKDSSSDANCPNNIYPNDILWEYPDFFTEAYGGNEYAQLYKIQGVTKDSGGTPLGGVSVELFRTLDDTRQDGCVSDAGGNYLLYSRYPDAHYIVAFKSPNLAGSTVQTLIGT